MKKLIYVVLAISLLLPATASAEFFSAGKLKEQLDMCLVPEKEKTEGQSIGCALGWGFVRGVTAGSMASGDVLLDRNIDKLNLRTQLRVLNRYLSVAPQGYLDNKPAAHAVMDALIQTHPKN